MWVAGFCTLREPYVKNPVNSLASLQDEGSSGCNTSKPDPYLNPAHAIDLVLVSSQRLLLVVRLLPCLLLPQPALL